MNLEYAFENTLCDFLLTNKLLSCIEWMLFDTYSDYLKWNKAHELTYLLSNQINFFRNFFLDNLYKSSHVTI